MSAAKRASALPPPPKPPTSLSGTITISENTSLFGNYPVTILSQSVIHPRSRINSTYGPVKLGPICIISERCNIGLQSPAPGQIEGVTLGKAVVVEVGAVVEAREVGEGCVIEVNAKVGKGSVLGKVSLY
jgi:dynactin-6